MGQFRLTGGLRLQVGVGREGLQIIDPGDDLVALGQLGGVRLGVHLARLARGARAAEERPALARVEALDADALGLARGARARVAVEDGAEGRLRRRRGAADGVAEVLAEDGGALEAQVVGAGRPARQAEDIVEGEGDHVGGVRLQGRAAQRVEVGRADAGAGGGLHVGQREGGGLAEVGARRGGGVRQQAHGADARGERPGGGVAVLLLADGLAGRRVVVDDGEAVEGLHAVGGEAGAQDGDYLLVALELAVVDDARVDEEVVGPRVGAGREGQEVRRPRQRRRGQVEQLLPVELGGRDGLDDEVGALARLAVEGQLVGGVAEQGRVEEVEGRPREEDGGGVARPRRVLEALDAPEEAVEGGALGDAGRGEGVVLVRDDGGDGEGLDEALAGVLGDHHVEVDEAVDVGGGGVGLLGVAEKAAQGLEVVGVVGGGGQAEAEALPRVAADLVPRVRGEDVEGRARGRGRVGVVLRVQVDGDVLRVEAVQDAEVPRGEPERGGRVGGVAGDAGGVLERDGEGEGAGALLAAGRELAGARRGGGDDKAGGGVARRGQGRNLDRELLPPALVDDDGRAAQVHVGVREAAALERGVARRGDGGEVEGGELEGPRAGRLEGDARLHVAGRGLGGGDDPRRLALGVELLEADLYHLVVAVRVGHGGDGYGVDARGQVSVDVGYRRQLEDVGLLARRVRVGVDEAVAAGDPDEALDAGEHVGRADAEEEGAAAVRGVGGDAGDAGGAARGAEGEAPAGRRAGRAERADREAGGPFDADELARGQPRLDQGRGLAVADEGDGRARLGLGDLEARVVVVDQDERVGAEDLAQGRVVADARKHDAHPLAAVGRLEVLVLEDADADDVVEGVEEGARVGEVGAGAVDVYLGQADEGVLHAGRGDVGVERARELRPRGADAELEVLAEGGVALEGEAPERLGVGGALEGEPEDGLLVARLARLAAELGERVGRGGGQADGRQLVVGQRYLVGDEGVERVGGVGEADAHGAPAPGVGVVERAQDYRVGAPVEGYRVGLGGRVVDRVVDVAVGGHDEGRQVPLVGGGEERALARAVADVEVAPEPGVALEGDEELLIGEGGGEDAERQGRLAPRRVAALEDGAARRLAEGEDGLGRLARREDDVEALLEAALAVFVVEEVALGAGSPLLGALEVGGHAEGEAEGGAGREVALDLRHAVAEADEVLVGVVEGGGARRHRHAVPVALRDVLLEVGRAPLGLRLEFEEGPAGLAIPFGGAAPGHGQGLPAAQALRRGLAAGEGRGDVAAEPAARDLEEVGAPLGHEPRLAAVEGHGVGLDVHVDLGGLAERRYHDRLAGQQGRARGVEEAEAVGRLRRLARVAVVDDELGLEGGGVAGLVRGVGGVGVGRVEARQAQGDGRPLRALEVQGVGHERAQRHEGLRVEREGAARAVGGGDGGQVYGAEGDGAAARLVLGEEDGARHRRGVGGGRQRVVDAAHGAERAGLGEGDVVRVPPAARARARLQEVPAGGLRGGGYVLEQPARGGGVRVRGHEGQVQAPARGVVGAAPARRVGEVADLVLDGRDGRGGGAEAHGAAVAGVLRAGEEGGAVLVGGGGLLALGVALVGEVGEGQRRRRLVVVYRHADVERGDLVVADLAQADGDYLVDVVVVAQRQQLYEGVEVGAVGVRVDAALAVAAAQRGHRDERGRGGVYRALVLERRRAVGYRHIDEFLVPGGLRGLHAGPAQGVLAGGVEGGARRRLARGVVDDAEDEVLAEDGAAAARAGVAVEADLVHVLLPGADAEEGLAVAGAGGVGRRVAGLAGLGDGRAAHEDAARQGRADQLAQGRRLALGAEDLDEGLARLVVLDAEPHGVAADEVAGLVVPEVPVGALAGPDLAQPVLVVCIPVDPSTLGDEVPLLEGELDRRQAEDDAVAVGDAAARFDVPPLAEAPLRARRALPILVVDLGEVEPGASADAAAAFARAPVVAGRGEREGMAHLVDALAAVLVVGDAAGLLAEEEGRRNGVAAQVEVRDAEELAPAAEDDRALREVGLAGAPRGFDVEGREVFGDGVVEPHGLDVGDVGGRHLQAHDRVVEHVGDVEGAREEPRLALVEANDAPARHDARDGAVVEGAGVAVAALGYDLRDGGRVVLLDGEGALGALLLEVDEHGLAGDGVDRVEDVRAVDAGGAREAVVVPAAPRNAREVGVVPAEVEAARGRVAEREVQPGAVAVEGRRAAGDAAPVAAHADEDPLVLVGRRRLLLAGDGQVAGLAAAVEAPGGGEGVHLAVEGRNLAREVEAPDAAVAVGEVALGQAVREVAADLLVAVEAVGVDEPVGGGVEGDLPVGGLPLQLAALLEAGALAAEDEVPPRGPVGAAADGGAVEAAEAEILVVDEEAGDIPPLAGGEGVDVPYPVEAPEGYLLRLIRALYLDDGRAADGLRDAGGRGPRRGRPVYDRVAHLVAARVGGEGLGALRRAGAEGEDLGEVVGVGVLEHPVVGDDELHPQPRVARLHAGLDGDGLRGRVLEVVAQEGGVVGAADVGRIEVPEHRLDDDLAGDPLGHGAGVQAHLHRHGALLHARRFRGGVVADELPEGARVVEQAVGVDRRLEHEEDLGRNLLRAEALVVAEGQPEDRGPGGDGEGRRAGGAAVVVGEGERGAGHAAAVEVAARARQLVEALDAALAVARADFDAQRALRVYRRVVVRVEDGDEALEHGGARVDAGEDERHAHAQLPGVVGVDLGGDAARLALDRVPAEEDGELAVVVAVGVAPGGVDERRVGVRVGGDEHLELGGALGREVEADPEGLRHALGQLGHLGREGRGRERPRRVLGVGDVFDVEGGDVAVEVHQHDAVDVGDRGARLEGPREGLPQVAEGAAPVGAVGQPVGYRRAAQVFAGRRERVVAPYQAAALGAQVAPVGQMHERLAVPRGRARGGRPVGEAQAEIDDLVLLDDVVAPLAHGGDDGQEAGAEAVGAAGVGVGGGEAVGRLYRGDVGARGDGDGDAGAPGGRRDVDLLVAGQPGGAAPRRVEHGRHQQLEVLRRAGELGGRAVAGVDPPPVGRDAARQHVEHEVVVAALEAEDVVGGAARERAVDVPGDLVEVGVGDGAAARRGRDQQLHERHRVVGGGLREGLVAGRVGDAVLGRRQEGDHQRPLGVQDAEGLVRLHHLYLAAVVGAGREQRAELLGRLGQAVVADGYRPAEAAGYDARQLGGVGALLLGRLPAREREVVERLPERGRDGVGGGGRGAEVAPVGQPLALLQLHVQGEGRHGRARRRDDLVAEAEARAVVARELGQARVLAAEGLADLAQAAGGHEVGLRVVAAEDDGARRRVDLGRGGGVVAGDDDARAVGVVVVDYHDRARYRQAVGPRVALLVGLGQRDDDGLEVVGRAVGEHAQHHRVGAVGQRLLDRALGDVEARGRAAPEGVALLARADAVGEVAPHLRRAAERHRVEARPDEVALHQQGQHDRVPGRALVEARRARRPEGDVGGRRGAVPGDGADAVLDDDAQADGVLAPVVEGLLAAEVEHDVEAPALGRHHALERADADARQRLEAGGARVGGDGAAHAERYRLPLVAVGGEAHARHARRRGARDDRRRLGEGDGAEEVHPRRVEARRADRDVERRRLAAQALAHGDGRQARGAVALRGRLDEGAAVGRDEQPRAGRGALVLYLDDDPVVAHPVLDAAVERCVEGGVAVAPDYEAGLARLVLPGPIVAEGAPAADVVGDEVRVALRPGGADAAGQDAQDRHVAEPARLDPADRVARRHAAVRRGDLARGLGGGGERHERREADYLNIGLVGVAYLGGEVAAVVEMPPPGLVDALEGRADLGAALGAVAGAGRGLRGGRVVDDLEGPEEVVVDRRQRRARDDPLVLAAAPAEQRGPPVAGRQPDALVADAHLEGVAGGRHARVAQRGRVYAEEVVLRGVLEHAVARDHHLDEADGGGGARADPDAAVAAGHDAARGVAGVEGLLRREAARVLEAHEVRRVTLVSNGGDEHGDLVALGQRRPDVDRNLHGARVRVALLVHVRVDAGVGEEVHVVGRRLVVPDVEGELLALPRALAVGDDVGARQVADLALAHRLKHEPELAPAPVGGVVARRGDGYPARQILGGGVGRDLVAGEEQQAAPVAVADQEGEGLVGAVLRLGVLVAVAPYVERDVAAHAVVGGVGGARARQHAHAEAHLLLGRARERDAQVEGAALVERGRRGRVGEGRGLGAVVARRGEQVGLGGRDADEAAARRAVGVAHLHHHPVGAREGVVYAGGGVVLRDAAARRDDEAAVVVGGAGGGPKHDGEVLGPLDQAVAARLRAQQRAALQVVRRVDAREGRGREVERQAAPAALGEALGHEAEEGGEPVGARPVLGDGQPLLEEVGGAPAQPRDGGPLEGLLAGLVEDAGHDVVEQAPRLGEGDAGPAERVGGDGAEALVVALEGAQYQRDVAAAEAALALAYRHEAPPAAEGAGLLPERHEHPLVVVEEAQRPRRRHDDHAPVAVVVGEARLEPDALVLLEERVGGDAQGHAQGRRVAPVGDQGVGAGQRRRRVAAPARREVGHDGGRRLAVGADGDGEGELGGGGGVGVVLGRVEAHQHVELVALGQLGQQAVLPALGHPDHGQARLGDAVVVEHRDLALEEDARVARVAQHDGEALDPLQQAVLQGADVHRVEGRREGRPRLRARRHHDARLRPRLVDAERALGRAEAPREVLARLGLAREGEQEDPLARGRRDAGAEVARVADEGEVEARGVLGVALAQAPVGLADGDGREVVLYHVEGEAVDRPAEEAGLLEALGEGVEEGVVVRPRGQHEGGPAPLALEAGDVYEPDAAGGLGQVRAGGRVDDEPDIRKPAPLPMLPAEGGLPGGDADRVLRVEVQGEAPAGEGAARRRRPEDDAEPVALHDAAEHGHAAVGLRGDQQVVDRVARGVHQPADLELHPRQVGDARRLAHDDGDGARRVGAHGADAPVEQVPRGGRAGGRHLAQRPEGHAAVLPPRPDLELDLGEVVAEVAGADAQGELGGGRLAPLVDEGLGVAGQNLEGKEAGGAGVDELGVLGGEEGVAPLEEDVAVAVDIALEHLELVRDRHVGAPRRGVAPPVGAPRRGVAPPVVGVYREVVAAGRALDGEEPAYRNLDAALERALDDDLIARRGAARANAERVLGGVLGPLRLLRRLVARLDLDDAALEAALELHVAAHD